MQFSIFGLIILGAYSGLILGLVAWPLSKLLRQVAWKWVVIAPPVLVLLALPWAEEAWIAWHFNEACKDAGVHVYRKVEVEGFVDDTSRRSRNGIKTGNWHFDPKSLADWDARGYRFQENMLDDGGVVHLERTPEGIVASILDRPTARYHYKNAYQPKPSRTEEPVGWRIRKTEKQIVDSLTGNVIARDTGFSRSPNTVELTWSRFLGSGGYGCIGSAPQPPKLRQSLFFYALVPRKPD